VDEYISAELPDLPEDWRYAHSVPQGAQLLRLQSHLRGTTTEAALRLRSEIQRS
jgi:hypothetical protein